MDKLDGLRDEEWRGSPRGGEDNGTAELTLLPCWN